MTKFDKKVKRLSKEFQVPETYHEKVDGILESIQEDRVTAPRKKPFVKLVAVVVAFCLLITGYLCFSSAKEAEASFFETFKQTIMDFFGMGESESQEFGVESKKEDAVSKPDLLIELQEVVMDTQNIYAVVKITAPPDVEFKEGMTFDYYGFCEGTNYNASDVIPGARECTLLEVMKNKSNIATFVVNICTDKQIKEGKEVTAFFNNLLDGPQNEDDTKVLVEGMWSLSFTASYTSSKEITVKGTEEMQYSYSYSKADIKKIKLLPLGLTMVSDVSRVDEQTRNTTDTRVVIRLKMIDGSEIIVDDPNDDKCLVSAGSVSNYDKKGHSYEKYVGQFGKAINIDQVLGIYIADCYVPIKQYE
ncbi:MAG: hypothetical protein K2K70_09760 [Lachnospiraceae bacterium]|nr:hypothetical protein [Lachnospiraceae bacterium]